MVRGQLSGDRCPRPCRHARAGLALALPYCGHDSRSQPAAHQHLARDPVLRSLLAAGPLPELPPAADPFASLIRSVTGQQLSVKAAAAINERLAAATGAFACGGAAHRPAADACATWGLSWAKVRTVQAIAAAASTPSDRFCRAGCPQRRGGHPSAAAAAGHRPLDGGDVFDLRAGPARRVQFRRSGAQKGARSVLPRSGPRQPRCWAGSRTAASPPGCCGAAFRSRRSSLPPIERGPAGQPSPPLWSFARLGGLSWAQS